MSSLVTIVATVFSWFPGSAHSQPTVTISCRPLHLQREIDRELLSDLQPRPVRAPDTESLQPADSRSGPAADSGGSTDRRRSM